MKKLLVMLMAIVLVGGCAWTKGFFCNPTEKQIEAANVGKAVVSALLVAATVYTGGSAVVTLLNASALTVYNKVVAGYCVAQADWDAATQALKDASAQTDKLAAAAQPKAPLKSGKLKITPNTDVKGAIDFVETIKW
jgi:hypothetical protein